MRGIRKAFGATVALDGVDLPSPPGEVCALVGENGAGKSTLMKILSGALAPDAGAMALDGAPYAPRSPLEARRAGVAMIYQELSLAPHLTVMENILLGVEPTRFGLVDRRADARRWRRAALAQLGHGDIAPDAPVGHAVGRGAAARRDRPRARGRLPRAGARRADQQPRPRRTSQRLFELVAPPARRRGTRSSTSRTSSRR